MGWQSHFSFTFSVSGSFGKVLQEQSALNVVADIPLDQLFATQFSTEVRELSLNHRKILWSYQNTPKAVWTKAAKELVTLINQHPAQTVTLKTSHAGVAVALFMLSETKHGLTKKIHFQFENAPLGWLEKHFAPVKGHSVEFIKNPSCVWSHNSRRAA